VWLDCGFRFQRVGHASGSRGQLQDQFQHLEGRIP